MWERRLSGRSPRIKNVVHWRIPPAHWRRAPLPQTLAPDEVNRWLGAFAVDLPSHMRCYALVRCVVDLGLRSSEAITLELDDIDWVAGTVRISKSKSRRADVLPLPHLTSAAIADYMRSERPQTTSHRVFVRHVAPVMKQWPPRSSSMPCASRIVAPGCRTLGAFPAHDWSVGFSTPAARSTRSPMCFAIESSKPHSSMPKSTSVGWAQWPYLALKLGFIKHVSHATHCSQQLCVEFVVDF